MDTPTVPRASVTIASRFLPGKTGASFAVPQLPCRERRAAGCVTPFLLKDLGARETCRGFPKVSILHRIQIGT